MELTYATLFKQEQRLQVVLIEVFILFMVLMQSGELNSIFLNKKGVTE